MISYASSKSLIPWEMCMANRFGDELKKIREKKRMTQSDLAARARVSLSTIQKCEASDEPAMHWTNFLALADALGMSEQQLQEAWQGDMARMEVLIPRPMFERIVKAASRADALIERYAQRLIAQAMGDKKSAKGVRLVERHEATPPTAKSASASSRRPQSKGTASPTRTQPAGRR